MREDDKNVKGAARREDWKTEPMSGKNAAFTLNRTFDNNEMDALCHGNVPRAMEDKRFRFDGMIG